MKLVAAATSAALVRGSRFGALAGRSVLIDTREQLAAAIAMVELDGIARRMVILPPGVDAAQRAQIIATAGIDAIVADDDLAGVPEPMDARCATEWVLLTSGTSGVPKLAVHTRASLTAPIRNHQGAGIVWGTFYDIRRYGGLQIFLRAWLGGTSLVLSDAAETAFDHLQRLAHHGVTHLTGTPSHWRRALMSAAAHSIAPRYVRLSGEIADQAILDALAAAYPRAAIGHAFASTEAGVAFEVDDALEGFPASYLGRRGDVELKIEDGSLRIRSPRTASRYLAAEALQDAGGFVDTGDMIEERGGRCRFLGRRSGVINVGGLKVHPEEVESVINRHPGVRMSCVRARRNPITGALVAAAVVPASEPAPALEAEILALCRESLARHKVPTLIEFVPSLGVGASGKIARA